MRVYQHNRDNHSLKTSVSLPALFRNIFTVTHTSAIIFYGILPKSSVSLHGSSQTLIFLIMCF